MINKDEILLKAQEFEIHEANVKRDYIFGWLLFGIFTESNFKDKIFLKGGNALRKGYFKNTRFSSDLDFGIPNNIDQNVLLEEINKVCDFIYKKSGVIFVKENNKIKEKFTAKDTPTPDLKVYEVRVYFRDFQGNADHLKIKISMDITRFDKALLPLQIVDLIHPYSDANKVSCKIRCMKLEEIIATKLKCILQRQHAPDLFDYVYTIKILGGKLNKEEVVRAFIKKTIFSQNPHVVKNILKKTPFNYFKEFWSKTIICAKQIIFEVEEAINVFILDLEVLFRIYPENGFTQYIYFGPEVRVPIMQAAREQTILKMRYKGKDREIEPYSLKYKQDRDGNEREYFYAYNVKGGMSEPGVRSFLADKVESIENTEVKFTPRFQIELSKAGELSEDRYLFDPNKPLQRRTGFGSKSDPKYSYQCNYCGKKFTKTKQNNSIGKHNNKSGYGCGGRSGIYLGTKY